MRIDVLRRAALVGVLALMLALPASTGASPLRAFLLAGAPDSFADLKAHPGAVGVLYPTYFYCRLPDAGIAGEDEPAVDEYAVAQRIAVMPRFSCQQKAAVHRILTDPTLRARTLAGLLALAANPLYKGLCLDFENDGAADREAFSSFVAELAHRLHARAKRLCVVVDGVTHEDTRASTGFYDDVSLGTLADEVFVLAWGVHWAGSAPGPIAPLRWVREVAAYVASLPNARRFVLGVPMYGLDWATGGVAGGGTAAGGSAGGGTAAGGSADGGGTSGGAAAGQGRSPARATAYQYTGVTALASAVGATPVRDPVSGEMTFSYTRAGVRHTVWYLDGHAVAACLRVGREAGLAVGLWRLGSEDQSLWSSLP